MQNSEIRTVMNPKLSRTFRFKEDRPPFNETYIRIYWHEEKGCWAGETVIWKAQADVGLWTGVVFSNFRTNLPRLLRVALAERDPRVKKVTDRIVGKPTRHSASQDLWKVKTGQ